MADHRTWLRRLFASKEETAPARVVQAPAPQGGPELVAEDSNDFALAMYAQLGQRPENVFFSSFSIRTALAMTYAGARGETAAQMATALRLPPADETLHAAFAKIIDPQAPRDSIHEGPQTRPQFLGNGRASALC